MNLFLKILAGVGIAGASLCTAGVLPGSLAVIFTIVSGTAAYLHPTPAATAAFGPAAK